MIAIQSALHTPAAEAFGFFTTESAKKSHTVRETDVIGSNVIIILGYIPLVGALVGTARFVLVKEEVSRGYYLANRIRALFEIAGCGLLLLPPDLIMTVYHHCGSSTFDSISPIFPRHKIAINAYRGRLEDIPSHHKDRYKLALLNYEQALFRIETVFEECTQNQNSIIAAVPQILTGDNLSQVRTRWSNFREGTMEESLRVARNSLGQASHSLNQSADTMIRVALDSRVC